MGNNPFGITRKMVLEILKESSKAMNFFVKNFKEKHNAQLSGKLLSETFSNLLEQKASQILTKRLGYEVQNPSGDRTPDLIFTKLGKPLEIKVTSEMNWRGGEFSTRPTYHMFVSRNDKFNEFFVVLIDMSKEGGLWESSMQKGKRYYAPYFKKEKIYEMRNKADILIGKITKNKKGTIKLIREKVI